LAHLLSPSDRLEHQPFPELAAALRSRVERILELWTEEIRRAIPSVADRPPEELIDNAPAILAGMADALETASRAQTTKLIERSPAQGVTRFQQNYDLAELYARRSPDAPDHYRKVEAALVRRMTQDEQVALDMAVDLMLQQSVIAFIGMNRAKLRAAAKSELKFLSFLSHDLNNNLGGVTLHLQVLRQRLAQSPDFAQDVAVLDQAQQMIRDTTGGMGRLLQSKRLRKVRPAARIAPVNLHQLASAIARQLMPQAERKRLRIAVEVPPDAIVHSDGELITLVLQNLLGNAIKYSEAGTVRIMAKPEEANEWRICVHDEGLGIAAEHRERIFAAFQRGDAHGQPGIGLGLAIATEATKLLRGSLTVESKLGVGSSFCLSLRCAE
jgi:signal transduction histidine kinase